jgi:phosphotransferase system IIB component
MNPIIIVCIAVGCAVLVAIIVFLILHIHKKQKIKASEEAADRKVVETAGKLSLCFGGNENILSIQQKGSRVSVLLKDISLVNKEEINKELSSVMFMNNKVVFIIGSKSEDFSRLLQENISKLEK